MGDDETARLYGPWRGRTPRDAVDLLAGYPGEWWVAGGWAVEAFTGVRRRHSDLDISIPTVDVPLLWEHVRGRLDVWAAFRGALRPLLGPDEALPEECGNLWLRDGGARPWEYDVLLTSTTGSTWTYERDPRVSAPLDDVLWARAGIRYLRPEVQLLYKARGLRDPDQADVDVALPLLDGGAARWLRDALVLAHPGHPWLQRLP